MPRKLLFDPETIIAPAPPQPHNRLAAYASQVPSAYRHLTRQDLPERITASVAAWWSLPGEQFLWLQGPSFVGKTAALWVDLAQRAATEALPWTVLPARDYVLATRGLGDQILTHRAHTVPVLLLDEWPLRINDGADVEVLRHLLNRRGAPGLRTVVTANGSPGLPDTLTGHQNPVVSDAARALHNRLRNFRTLRFDNQPYAKDAR